MLKCFLLLAQDGIKIDAKDAAGFTALDFAMAANHLDITKILVEKGIEVSPSQEKRIKRSWNSSSS